MHEPDELSWLEVTPTGNCYPCLIVRHPRSGTLNGYIALSSKHPWSGESYDDIPIETHGGLTYGDFWTPGFGRDGSALPTDVIFWIGFDCNHAFDYAPAYNIHATNVLDGIYCDLNYVKDMVLSMVRQAELASTTKRLTVL